MTKIEESTQFLYRDFYDVPRMLVCVVDGKKVLLDSPFDDASDDYSVDYYVYTLPRDLDVGSMKSWRELPSMATQFIGKLPIMSVQFDQSKRKEFKVAVLVDLLQSPSV